MVGVTRRCLDDRFLGQRAQYRAPAPALFADFDGAFEESVPEAAARNLETDEVLDISGIRIVEEQTLYRENNLWVTPETSGLDLEDDADDITVVEKFSDTYFELVRENTKSDNELLSSQLDERRMREYNRRLSSEGVRRILAHPNRAQHDKLIGLVQVSDLTTLANVLDEEVVDFLRGLIRS